MTTPNQLLSLAHEKGTEASIAILNAWKGPQPFEIEDHPDSITEIKKAIAAHRDCITLLTEALPDSITVDARKWTPP